MRAKYLTAKSKKEKLSEADEKARKELIAKGRKLAREAKKAEKNKDECTPPEPKQVNNKATETSNLLTLSYSSPHSSLLSLTLRSIEMRRSAQCIKVTLRTIAKKELQTAKKRNALTKTIEYGHLDNPNCGGKQQQIWRI